MPSAGKNQRQQRRDIRSLVSAAARSIMVSHARFAIGLILLCCVASVRGAGAQTTADVLQLPAPSERWAVVIGISNYDDKDWPALYGRQDAEAIRQNLVDIAGFPPEQTFLLTDGEKNEQATRDNIIARLTHVANNVSERGLVFVFFSGHGVSSGNETYVIPKDTRHTAYELGLTALSAAEIRSALKRALARQVMIFIDACRDRMTASKSDAPPIAMSSEFVDSFNLEKMNLGKQAFATVYATSLGYSSYSYHAKSMSFFSWVLDQGFKGKAYDEKGELTLASLIGYVEKETPPLVRREANGKTQEPDHLVGGYRSHEVVLAARRGSSPPKPPAPATTTRTLQLTSADSALASNAKVRVLYQDGVNAERLADSQGRVMVPVRNEAATDVLAWGPGISGYHSANGLPGTNQIQLDAAPNGGSFAMSRSSGGLSMGGQYSVLFCRRTLTGQIQLTSSMLDVSPSTVNIGQAFTVTTVEGAARELRIVAAGDNFALVRYGPEFAGTTRTLAITVKNAKNEPVKGATVGVQYEYSVQSAETNEQGVARFIRADKPVFGLLVSGPALAAYYRAGTLPDAIEVKVDAAEQGGSMAMGGIAGTVPIAGRWYQLLYSKSEANQFTFRSDDVEIAPATASVGDAFTVTTLEGSSRDLRVTNAGRGFALVNYGSETARSARALTLTVVNEHNVGVGGASVGLHYKARVKDAKTTADGKTRFISTGEPVIGAFVAGPGIAGAYMPGPLPESGQLKVTTLRDGGSFDMNSAAGILPIGGKTTVLRYRRRDPELFEFDADTLDISPRVVGRGDPFRVKTGAGDALELKITTATKTFLIVDYKVVPKAP
jgi:hypothetical protein